MEEVEGERVEKEEVNAKVVVVVRRRRRKRRRRGKGLQRRVGEAVDGLLCGCGCGCVLVVVVVVVMVVDMKEARRGKDARLTHGLAFSLIGEVRLPVCVCV